MEKIKIYFTNGRTAEWDPARVRFVDELPAIPPAEPGIMTVNKSAVSWFQIVDDDQDDD